MPLINACGIIPDTWTEAQPLSESEPSSLPWQSSPEWDTPNLIWPRSVLTDIVNYVKAATQPGNTDKSGNFGTPAAPWGIKIGAKDHADDVIADLALLADSDQETRNSVSGFQATNQQASTNRAELPQMLSLEFASFSDGTAFSQARQIRIHLGQNLRLRAVGKLIADQFAFALRCGFNEVLVDEAVFARQPWDQWLAALNAIDLHYQNEVDAHSKAIPQLRRLSPANS